MKKICVKAKTDSQGNLHVPVGIANAGVEVTILVESEGAGAGRTLGELLDRIGPLTSLERYPEWPLRDPWEDADA